ncbi:nucleotide sugar dehydrogenase [Akkermansiaceae bacterium]|nr:nucleotide sugar dehydrogenase [Akkermansiaceae bacterium]
MSLSSKIEKKEVVIGIIGLGYVGLPLAVEFGKQFKTRGFDIDKLRVDELRQGIDRTLECSSDQLEASIKLTFSTDLGCLEDCNIYIVTVPTPIDQNKTPDLRPLIGACKTVGKVLKPGNLVIFESTVYPGCTEEDCVPILELKSGLTYNSEFFCGYSPERINPGDKERTVTKIIKVTSGSTPEIAEVVDTLYKSIITAGTHLAPSIKVAEAAKVIENSQRDINIAFVNELSMIFHRMGIDTNAVLKAAGTKWNFLPFRPGLVGGHCIGVDPYYLTQRAKQVGYHPEIILAGRRLNDNMGKEVCQRVVKLMINKGHRILGAKVLILGITFKENCPDIRNSRVIDVIEEFREFGCDIQVYDPWADPLEVKTAYGIKLIEKMPNGSGNDDYDAIILAVAHSAFKKTDYTKLSNENCILFDLKGILPKFLADGSL